MTETVNYPGFSLTHSYTYYRNGLKETFTGPDGISYGYLYDDNNQLTGVQIPDAGMFTVNGYDWNRPFQETLPGGGQRDYTYDPLMRVSQITARDPGGNQQLSYGYSYDKMDNITDRQTGHGDYAYRYDALDRLTGADTPEGQTDESFEYDAVGNRVGSAATSGAWRYNADNQLEGYDDVTFQYDANGNMIEKSAAGVVTRFFYNPEDRLERVEDGDGNMIATYYYDPFGRRLWKEVGGTRTYFHYSDEGLVGEYDQTGSQIKAYGWKPGSTWSTDPLFMKQAGQYYWYHNDHLGTPQMMTTSSGAVVWKANYTAFGKAAVDPISTVDNPLRLPGQYEDAETGLHYNWFRYYNSDSGRYLRIDPLRISQLKIAIQRINNDIRESSKNEKNGKSLQLLLVANLFYSYELYNIQAHDLYAFVLNNPVNLVDPSGENPIIAWVVGGALIGGASGAISGAITGAITGMMRDSKDLGYLGAAAKGFFKGMLVGAEVGAAVGAVVGPVGALPAGGLGGLVGNLIGGELLDPQELDFPPFEDPCNP